jgi:hypothetical protein
MAGRRPNASKSKQVTVALSEQSLELLVLLAKRGVYGRSEADVAGRFVDQALANFIEVPKYRVGTNGVKEIK